MIDILSLRQRNRKTLLQHSDERAPSAFIPPINHAIDCYDCPGDCQFCYRARYISFQLLSSPPRACLLRLSYGWLSFLPRPALAGPTLNHERA